MAWRNREAIYALYKGDDLVMLGTITEIAKARHVRRETILWLLTPTYKSRCQIARKDGKPSKRIVLVLAE